MTDEIRRLEIEVETAKARLAEARRAAPPELVHDLVLMTTYGPGKLSGLFGDKSELIVVHNMGRSCPYCTLWADGFNGLTRHLEDRSAFVVCSPDSVDVQAEFAISRGWTFRMVSDSSGEFTSAMGFGNKKDGWWPGASAFINDGGELYRTGRVVFGPGDDFCGIWPMMDLLGGDKGWEPKLAYPNPGRSELS